MANQPREANLSLWQDSPVSGDFTGNRQFAAGSAQLAVPPPWVRLPSRDAGREPCAARICGSRQLVISLADDAAGGSALTSSAQTFAEKTK